MATTTLGENNQSSCSADYCGAAIPANWGQRILFVVVVTVVDVRVVVVATRSSIWQRIRMLLLLLLPLLLLLSAPSSPVFLIVRLHAVLSRTVIGSSRAATTVHRPSDNLTRAVSSQCLLKKCNCKLCGKYDPEFNATFLNFCNLLSRIFITNRQSKSGLSLSVIVSNMVNKLSLQQSNLLPRWHHLVFFCNGPGALLATSLLND